MDASTQLNFPDAMRIPVDAAVVDRLVAQLDLDGDGIGAVRPDWGSDLVWLSGRDAHHVKLFEQVFEALGVADHVRDRLDLKHAPRLYSGFILRRSRCEVAAFHTDWRGTQRQAFTFLTAVGHGSGEFGLLYHDRDDRIVSYDYRPDEGILFGDDFNHSTRPGASDVPVTLLCFEFGTDRMRYWPQIFGCIDGQSLLIRRPDGKLIPGRRATSWRARLRSALVWRLRRLARALN